MKKIIDKRTGKTIASGPALEAVYDPARSIRPGETPELSFDSGATWYRLEDLLSMGTGGPAAVKITEYKYKEEEKND